MNHLPVYPKAFIAAAKLTRERKRVFAAMPFEAPHSARLWTIIQHECQIRDANPRRGDSPVNPVPIVADILDEMERAEIIIVDLTGNNPNVFYELGIAHTRCDKVLLLCEQGQSRPSDVGFFRCLLFDLKTPQGRAAFSRDLGTRLDDLLKPDGTPTFIEGLIERTQTVIEDLNVLALLPDEELRNETIWFSGFLSTLAVGKEEFFQPGNEKYRDALLEEKRLLLHLAERGCTLRCIISPTEIDVRTHRLPHAMQRLRNLISFLKSNHPAHQNIYWAISPFRQQNSYIIGSLCFSQGFKSEVVHGYPLTLRQTNAEAIRSATDLQQVLFERLRSHTLAAFPSRHRDERKGLRMSTLRCLEQALRWCESAADANKPKPRSRRK